MQIAHVEPWDRRLVTLLLLVIIKSNDVIKERSKEFRNLEFKEKKKRKER